MHCDRIAAPFCSNDGGMVEVAGEALRVNSGGGDDELKIGTFGQ